MNSGLVGALGAAPLRVTGMTRRIAASGPNAGTNALQLQATGGGVNVDIVLQPKNGGAIIVGPPPDNTTLGGNKRGFSAIDLQAGDRANANHVASGNRSIILAGGRNTASAQYAAAGGYQSTASANESFAFSGSASGQASVAFGGSSSNVSAVSFHGNSYRRGMLSAGTFRNSAGWLALWCNARMTNLTTNNTPTELALRDDGSFDRFGIASGRMGFYDIKIIGIKSDGTSIAQYWRKVCIKNVAGTTSLVGAVEIIGTDYEDNPLTDVAITASDANDSLIVTVTGIASETWRWVAIVEGAEVAYGT